jgi:pimeloyl-ACP methyl ester carboxylesterase
MCDLRGHGDSPPLAEGADLGALGRDVLDTAAALATEPPLRLVGHSLGGRVALAAAHAAPGRVGSVTLLDIAPGPIEESRGENGALLASLLAAPAAAPDRRTVRGAIAAAGVSPALADWLVMNLVRRGDGYAWRVDRAALAALRARTDAEDLWPVVEARPAGLSVRCIRGARSPYVTAADAARFAAAGCRVDTIPDAGHLLHVDQPDRLLGLLTG